MNDIIKVIKSLEDLGAVIDGVTETVKHEIKKRQIFRAPSAASLVQPVISSVVNSISGSGVRGTGREYMDKNF